MIKILFFFMFIICFFQSETSSEEESQSILKRYKRKRTIFNTKSNKTIQTELNGYMETDSFHIFTDNQVTEVQSVTKQHKQLSHVLNVVFNHKVINVVI
jgi:hypothetical protein